MSEPVQGLVVAHSSLAAGLAQAVRQITGTEEDVLRSISNDGVGPEALLEAVNTTLRDGPAILFVDLPSGSCAFAARKVAFTRPSTAVIFGTNLPVLLDFVFHRELGLSALVDRLVQKGRTGISGSCKEDPAHADRALSS